MSDDEIPTFILSSFVALAVYGSLAWSTMTLPAHLSSRSVRSVVALGVLFSFELLAVVLRKLASFDVRDSPGYLAFYVAMGAAWTAGTLQLPIGVSVRDDVLERNNLAAAIAWAGACVGWMACFAGANVGDGPSFVCVIQAALLSSLAFWMATAVVNRASRLQESVTLDRDLAAGIRLASFFIAAGILFGRGAAGDFVSFQTTVLDMASSWPALVLVAKVVLAERWLRPTPERPVGNVIAHGVVPAMVDVMLVLAGLVLVGAPPDGYVPPADPAPWAP